jgi:hypothetical protein
MSDYDEYPFFPKAAKRISKKIDRISKAEPINFLAPFLFFCCLFFIACVDAAVAVPFYSPINANLYTTFCLALFLFGFTIRDILIRMSEAKTRIEMATLKIAGVSDGEVEIVGVIKSTNTTFRSPVFNLECLAYRTRIEYLKKRKSHNSAKTVFTTARSIDGIFIDDGTGTAFPPKVKLEDFTLKITETTKDPQFAISICNKYNLEDDHPLKEANRYIGGDIYLDRFSVTETIVLPNTEGMFTGRLETVNVEKDSDIEEYFQDRPAGFKVSVDSLPCLSQTKRMFQKYANVIQLEKRNQHDKEHKALHLLLPLAAEKSGFVASSTRFKEERKDVRNKFLSSTFVLVVAMVFMISAFRFNTWV